MEENQEFGFGHLDHKLEMSVKPYKWRCRLTVEFMMLGDMRQNVHIIYINLVIARLYMI